VKAESASVIPALDLVDQLCSSPVEELEASRTMYKKRITDLKASIKKEKERMEDMRAKRMKLEKIVEACKLGEGQSAKLVKQYDGELKLLEKRYKLTEKTIQLAKKN